MDLVAGDMMTCPVISAREDMTVKELIALLQENQISGVPVVNASGRLVGVVSITDLIALGTGVEVAPEVSQSDFHTSPAMDGLSRASGLFQPRGEILERPVGTLMCPNVITATEQTPVGEIADTMVSRHIHRVIIVRGEKAVGIVSITDILRMLRDRYRARG